MSKSEIRIVLVGEAKSGKTSIISSFLNESFDPNCVSVLPEISISADMTVDRMQTTLVDTSSLPEDVGFLETEIERSSVVALVYDVTDSEHLDRLSSFWMPYLRDLIGKSKSVILVGNKTDLLDQSSTNSSSIAENYIIPLMNEYKEIETCIECSAKELSNITEVFYFASKAFLYPTFPIFDSADQRLKPAAEAALVRIFRLCDRNKDKLLDDEELNAFQRKVFGSPLQQQELEGVKEVVRESIGDGLERNNLTEKGFVYLHTLFIIRGRVEIIWAVFRKFGYDDNLQLRVDFLQPVVEVNVGLVTELSPSGYQFLTEVFQAFDKDKDGCLNEAELAELFSTAPNIPWISNTRMYESSSVGLQETTLHKFFAIWNMITLIDYRTTLAYLAYLGYEGNTVDGIKILPSGRGRRGKAPSNRNVFHGLVLGPTGCGKTEFLKGFIGQDFSSEYQADSKPWTVVNSLEIKGSEKYLVLEEVKSEYAWDILQDGEKLLMTDLIIFVYDTSDPYSFSYLANLRKLCDLTKIPVVFIGTKTDLGEVEQKCELNPEDYTKAIGLASPIKVSMKKRDIPDIYNILLGVAMNPSVAMPARDDSLSTFQIALGLSFLTSTLVIGGFFAYRHLKRSLTSVADT